MPTFDGPNLLITLDPGVTEVDVVNDLYRAWKDFMLADPVNRRYPQAFRSDGGTPLTAIINQGSYIFLNNVDGWRIKPPEEDITIFLTGNLAVEDVTLPSIIPTTGNFTAAVLGLQPITQGVVPTMRTQLELVAFSDGVTLDPINGYPLGASVTGIVGTRQFPVNTAMGAHLLSETYGLRNIYVLADYTVPAMDMSTHKHIWIGDSGSVSLTVAPGGNYTDHTFKNMTIEGEFDPGTTFDFCHLGTITNFSGEAHDCTIMDTVTCTGDAAFLDCVSKVPGAGSPTININGNSLQIRKWSGSLVVQGANDPTKHHSIEVYGGRVTIDSTCTAGMIHIRGAPFDVVNNATGTATVMVETEGKKMREVHARVGLNPDLPVTNNTDGSFSFTGANVDATSDGSGNITHQRT